MCAYGCIRGDDFTDADRHWHAETDTKTGTHKDADTYIDTPSQKHTYTHAVPAMRASE